MTKKPGQPEAEPSTTISGPISDLIEQSTASTDKPRKETLFRSAGLSAIDETLDRRTFKLDVDASETFAAILANPPVPADALRTLMANKYPWE